MKIFPPKAIKEIDQYTIANEPITDFDLMERASMRLFKWIEQKKELHGKVLVFVGPGNNGGDGLALARMLSALGKRFDITVCICNPQNEFTPSAHENLKRWLDLGGSKTIYLDQYSTWPQMHHSDVVIDALFGAGLNRPLKGWWVSLIDFINNSKACIISIDFPSGLLGESNRENSRSGIVCANYTLTFQFPKLSLLLPENEKHVGALIVLDIGLHKTILNELSSPFYFVEKSMVALLIKRRRKFSHKGTFGHALLYAGSYGKMGAAVLSAKACLKAGVGLLTVHVPSKGYGIMQIAVPEAMAEIDDSDYFITSPKSEVEFDAIGIGPGIGQKLNTTRAFEKIISTTHTPMVIDADGLNILAANRSWLQNLPKDSILTPHSKEFERIAGNSDNDYDQLMMLKKLAVDCGVYIVLKGAYSKIACPNGLVFFNSTGNPGMATAGSGDVLTGILTSLLAQGYSSLDACVLGVYLHGLAGDIAAEQFGYESLIASDIINHLGAAFKTII